MGEILWHCRETRQPTEKTNLALRLGHGETPEGLSGSERLACKKRSVEDLGDPILEEPGAVIPHAGICAGAAG